MMKNITKLCMMASVVTALGLAQGRPANGRMGGTPPDPQTMIKMRVDHLTAELNLTDAQKTSATTIFTDAYTASQAIRSSLQTNRQSLSDAVKKNDTATIDRLAATAGTLSGQLTAIESKADAAFYALLTADQQATYDSMPHGGPMGPGGFGPRRGGPRQ